MSGARYTLCSDANGVSALLFEGIDVDGVAAIPELGQIFQMGHTARLVGYNNPMRWDDGWSEKETPGDKAKHVLVSPAPIDFPPDKAGADKGITFYYNGKRYHTTFRERYNQCLSLFKAVGCKACPDRGLKCLGEGAGFTVKEVVEPVTEDFHTQLSTGYKKLGNYEWVEPSKTRSKNEFTSRYRKYWEHSFALIEQNADELSVRATDAAVTRKFKKEQCSKCVIRDSCHSAKHCKGAFPPLRDIVGAACHEFYSALDKSSWPAWQLWTIAGYMGREAKHSRWNIFLAGLKLQGRDGLVPTVKRARMRIDEYKLTTWDEISDVFEIPKTEATSVPPVLDPEIVATFWLALNSTHAYQRYGWGCERHVCGLGVYEGGVNVQWTNGKYLSRRNTLTKVSEVAEHLTYGRLAHISKIEVRK